MDSSFHRMKIKDIHASNERFSVYPLKKFTINFKSLKKTVDELRVQVDFDNQAVSQHKKMYPWVPQTKQEYPYWDDHLARQFLEDDIHNGNANAMLSSQLRMTWRCYQDFPPNIFCARVHAKARKQKEQTFWAAKRNKTAMSCHLKEVTEIKKIAMP